MAFLQEYTMLDELGKGGFATVYKVRHNDLGYIRAIRVLNETIVDSNSPTWQKFLRECKVLLRLGNGNHPNIVHIYQPRLLDNKALVEMDYVDGQDILHYLNQNQNFVPVEEVLHMAMQMSSSLAYCHEIIYKFCMDRDADSLQDDPNDGSKVLIDAQTRKRLIEKYKVIHNDIHSGNIMRREDGNFVLLDFGLAINGCEVVRSSRRKNGAPEFKAPEKWDDESILTEQSDIYSFGIVLYQYLAGRVPFPFNTNISSIKAEYALSEAHQKETPPSIETLRKEFFEKKFEGKQYKRDYPQWLEEVIMKCLNKSPKDRFRNGRELYDRIKKHALEETKSSEEIEKMMEQLKAQNKGSASEMENLREVNKSLNMLLNEKQNLILQKEQELREANEKIKLLEEKKKPLDIEVNELKTSNKSLNMMLNEKQNLILQKEQELREANEKIKLLEEKKKQLDIEVNELRTSNKSLNVQINEHQKAYIKEVREQRKQAEPMEQKKTEEREPVRDYLTRYCRKCGTVVSDNAVFCKKCGNKVKL